MDSRLYIYHTRGVCPPEIHFEIDVGRIRNLRFEGGGCPGNARLVSRLLEGKSLDEVMNHIEGIECRNDTSCAHELARAIQAVGDGTLAAADSFKVRKDDRPRRSIAFIGHPAGDNTGLEKTLQHIRDCEVDAIVCLGNITGDSPQNEDLIKTIRRCDIAALQGERDWRCARDRESPAMPSIQPRSRDWLLQLPHVLSFRLNGRQGMAFFGDFIQSFPDYSDFEPFALEMNMVCGLTAFMQDETVFPALEAMTPQFKADIVIFSQVQTWGTWHVGGKDFISIGPAGNASESTWGLLSESQGRVDFKIMKATT